MAVLEIVATRLIQAVGNLLCDVARWIAVAHGYLNHRNQIAAQQERAWMDAVAACRRMPSDDTDHITIARQHGNLFD